MPWDVDLTVVSGVKMVMASPGLSWSMAFLKASGSTVLLSGKESKEVSRLL